MSDTPKDPGTGSGESPEYRDPTAPGWDEGGERSDQTESIPESGATPESTSEVTWSTGDETQAVPADSTQQLPSEQQPLQPPSASQPSEPAPSPYGQAPTQPQGQPGQAPSPYGQAQGPYAAGAPGGYPSQPGPPPAYGQQPAGGQPYGQPQPYGRSQPYGQPQPYGQAQPYGQQGQPGYAPSPYARPRQANTSAIVLLVVSGLSTLVGCFFAIPALILGIMAVVKQGESPADSAKFTRWGWVAYAIAIAFVVIGGLIAIAIFASTSTTTGY